MKLKKVVKNLKLIQNIKLTEFNFILYKSLYNSYHLPFFLKTYIYYKYIINLNYLKLKTGCFITYRMRSKYNFFNLSRIKIRDLASYKLLTGIRKSS